MVLKCVYRLCSQAMSVKGSEACQILPIMTIITFLCCSSFPVLLFSSFSSLGKRYQITGVRSHVRQDPALIPVLSTDLTFFAFYWTDLSDLDDPLD